MAMGKTKTMKCICGHEKSEHTKGKKDKFDGCHVVIEYDMSGHPEINDEFCPCKEFMSEDVMKNE